MIGLRYQHCGSMNGIWSLVDFGGVVVGRLADKGTERKKKSKMR